MKPQRSSRKPRRSASANPSVPVAAKPSRASAIGLALLLLTAAVPRFYHLDHGLPGMVYADSVKFVDEASRMVSTGNLKPNEFQYPGLFTNLLALLYWVSGAQSVYWQQLIGHVVSALAGVGLACAVYGLALTVTGPFGAIAAALLAALSITSVTESRIPAPDSLAVLLMVSALVVLWRKDHCLRKYAIAGILCGFSAALKWTGLYLLPCIPVAVWLIDGKRRVSDVVRCTAVSWGCAAAAIVIASPWVAFMPGRFVARLGIEQQIQRYGQIGRVQVGYLDYWTSWTPTWEQPWLGTSFLSNYGILVTALLLAAVAWGVAGRGGKRVALLAGYGVVYLLIVSGPGHVKAFRFLLPALPVFFVLIGWFVDSVVGSRLGRFRLPVTAALVALLCLFPAWKSYDYLAHTRHSTTNDLAQEWARKNIPPGTRLFASPFFTGNLRQLPLKLSYLPNAASRQYRVPDDPVFNGEINPVYGSGLLKQIRAEGMSYVVLNSYFNDAFSPVAENLRYFPRSVSGYRDFLVGLQTEATLVYSVKGWSENRLGPDIAIYRLN